MISAAGVDPRIVPFKRNVPAADDGVASPHTSEIVRRQTVVLRKRGFL